MVQKVLVVFGTRPEAIKMAPVIGALRARADAFDVRVLSTGQHREMLQQVIELFDIKPDVDLEVMTAGQDLAQVTALILTRLGEALEAWRPDWVLVQGDTSTAFAAALACFYAKVRCAHVEAGLRTWDLSAPWPEEMHRVLLTQIAEAHFPPTEHAKNNLLLQRVPEETIEVTGNTVIDALLDTKRRIDTDKAVAADLNTRFDFLDPQKKLVLVTGHRRENFGLVMHRLCQAMRQLSERDDVQLVYAVHRNPNVQDVVSEVLGPSPAILIEPQQYLPFVYLMDRSHLIISDSGGVQEEAPSLGKPVLVTREKTERVEAVEAGTVKLVGTDGHTLVREATTLLDDADAYAAMAHTENPYGDGTAGVRIANWLAIS